MLTLRKIVDTGQGLIGNCTHPNCGKSRKLDMDALMNWLGEDYDFINETRIAAAFKCGVPGHKGGVIHIRSRPPDPYAEVRARR